MTFLNIPTTVRKKPKKLDLIEILKGVFNQINQNKFDFMMKIILKKILDHLDTHLFIKRTVKELISGYDDPLMEMASGLLKNDDNDGKFGLMKENGTESQNYSINTGFSDLKNVGKIISWNGLK